MAKKKIYKKGVRYYSTKKGIYGLTICGVRNSGWKYDFHVLEDFSPNLDMLKRKTVYRGTLTECRQFLKDRFKGKKRDFPPERQKFW